MYTYMTPSKGAIACFGLHKAKNDLYYLFQDTNPQGFDFLGTGQKSGLSSATISGRCPHIMNPYLRQRSVPRRHNQTFERIASDPLVRVMSPVPSEFKGGKIFQMSSDSLRFALTWLKTLERLSSPSYSQVINLSSQSKGYIKRALEHTNLQPMVLSNIHRSDEDVITEIIAKAKTSPRTLLLVSDFNIKGITEIKTRLPELIDLNDLVTLSLEHIGVRLIDLFIKEGSLPWQQQTAA